jgi:membrane-associated phospholipid phosphatase
MGNVRLGLLMVFAAAAIGCDPGSEPVSPAAVLRAGVPFTEGLASPEWQETAASLVGQARFNPNSAGRVYALLGVAQYLAVQQAEAAAGGADANIETTSGLGVGSGGRSRLEADRGAVAGASAVVLTYLFPSQAQALEDMVAAQAVAGPGQPHPAFAAAEAIGRDVGDQIVARAQSDGFSQPATGTPPVGPGYWTSANPPAVVGGQLPGVTRWFLSSADQFRPPAPPAFDSEEFLAALGEVRQFSDNRTAEQTQIAAFWAQGAGTPTTPGFWVGTATDEIRDRQLSERDATHLYALLGAAMFDAMVGCWDAKLTYWLIRPWQADPAITVVPAVGQPNHPSYPSGHSCVSSSAAAVLGTFFPEERPRLDAMVTEAGLSRLYGGIHYRFDMTVGQQIGQSVAAFAIAADASGNSPLTPQ